jgi:23S rRNA pseudouridine2605 synthase
MRRRDPDTISPPTRKEAERVAKVIARAGLGSRREVEEWITAGRVAINGAVITSPAVNVTLADQVTVDGEKLPERERTRLFLYHKTKGLMTTRIDPEGRPTIFGALPKDLPRLISIGRLDFNTEGLLLLTNDGGLARTLELPQTGWLRRYRVRAYGNIRQDALDALRGGVTVNGIEYGPIEASIDRVQASNVWLTFAIREGKNREVRNVLSHLGLEVNRLIRVSFGPFQLGELREGAVEEVRTRTLREQIGERLAAMAAADFDSPITPRGTNNADTRPEKRPDKKPRSSSPRENDRASERVGDGSNKSRDDRRPQEQAQERRAPHSAPRSGHVWRDHDAPRRSWSAKKSGHQSSKSSKQSSRQEDATGREKHAGLLKDKKGRRVLVERIRSAEPKAVEKKSPGKAFRTREHAPTTAKSKPRSHDRSHDDRSRNDRSRNDRSHDRRPPRSRGR